MLLHHAKTEETGPIAYWRTAAPLRTTTTSKPVRAASHVTYVLLLLLLPCAWCNTRRPARRMVDIVKDLREYAAKYPPAPQSELDEFGAGHFLLTPPRFHEFLKRLQGGLVQRVSFAHTAAGRRAAAAGEDDQDTDQGPGDVGCPCHVEDLAYVRACRVRVPCGCLMLHPPVQA